MGICNRRATTSDGMRRPSNAAGTFATGCQSAVDRAMAVRLLAYTALLYDRLVADGALREHGAPPPVLPIVIYNGRRPWTAAADVAELVASGGPALAPYQPSQRYFLLDEGRARRVICRGTIWCRR